MAATFTAPLAGILVAIELLLFELRARSFIPVALAASVATGVRELWLFALMGIVMGAVGIVMIRVLAWLEDFLTACRSSGPLSGRR